MPENDPSAQIYPLPIETAVIEGLFESPFRPNHDQKWRELGPGDAAFARAALIRAEEIRGQRGRAAGDAYLEGFADYHAALLRQGMVEAYHAADADVEMSRLTA